jgi:hypothetical protein
LSIELLGRLILNGWPAGGNQCGGTEFIENLTVRKNVGVFPRPTRLGYFSGGRALCRTTQNVVP